LAEADFEAPLVELQKQIDELAKWPGDPEKDREALIKLSPLTYLDRLKAPLLIIQGANDPRVPAGEAIQIHDALVARGIKTQLIIFPDEGHGATKRSNQVVEIGAMLDFLEQTLKTKPGS